jgi:hypothetical protein
MELKYILKIFIVTFIIFSLIVFINLFGLKLQDVINSKKLLQIVTVEGFNKNKLDTSLIMDANKAFCETNSGANLDESCKKLTQNNCRSTSCCIWTSKNTCVAGGENGPLFNSDSNGKTETLDYYYFENKCYGDKCS